MGCGASSGGSAGASRSNLEEVSEASEKSKEARGGDGQKGGVGVAVAGRHAIWVDSGDVRSNAYPLQDAGIKVHFFGETADCLAALGKEGPTSGDCLVVVITSMMRRQGRQERGLMDGLYLLDTIRARMQKEANASNQPLFAVISATADRQECVDHGVDVIVIGDRIDMQRKVLAAINSSSDRAWRTEYRDATKQNCRNIFQAAQMLKRYLEQEYRQKSNRELDELLSLTTDHCFCDRCEPKAQWTRGGQKYVLPTNWYRLGLNVREEYLDRRSEIEMWPVAYHGASRHAVLSILRHHRLMFPGDKLLDDTVLKIKCNNCWAERIAEKDQPVIYVSPSVIYAGAPYYAKPFELGQGRMAQVVFQVRVKPSSINKLPETLHNKYNDPEFSREELEWVISDRNAVVPYGLLIRYIEGAPAIQESLWITGNESSSNGASSANNSTWDGQSQQFSDNNASGEKSLSSVPASSAVVVTENASGEQSSSSVPASNAAGVTNPHALEVTREIYFHGCNWRSEHSGCDTVILNPSLPVCDQIDKLTRYSITEFGYQDQLEVNYIEGVYQLLEDDVESNGSGANMFWGNDCPLSSIKAPADEAFKSSRRVALCVEIKPRS